MAVFAIRDATVAEVPLAPWDHFAAIQFAAVQLVLPDGDPVDDRSLGRARARGARHAADVAGAARAGQLGHRHGRRRRRPRCRAAAARAALHGHHGGGRRRVALARRRVGGAQQQPRGGSWRRWPPWPPCRWPRRRCWPWRPRSASTAAPGCPRGCAGRWGSSRRSARSAVVLAATLPGAPFVATTGPDIPPAITFAGVAVVVVLVVLAGRADDLLRPVLAAAAPLVARRAGARTVHGRRRPARHPGGRRRDRDRRRPGAHPCPAQAAAHRHGVRAGRRAGGAGQRGRGLAHARRVGRSSAGSPRRPGPAPSSSPTRSTAPSCAPRASRLRACAPPPIRPWRASCG